MLSLSREILDLLTMGTITLFLVYPYTHRTLCVFYQDIPLRFGSLISSRSQRIYTSAMKQTLEMVWRHSEGQAGPCMRCTDTGKTFLELLKELLPVFDDEGIRLDFREELVPPGTAVPINHLRVNGIPLHVLLSRAAEGEEYCHASKCMPLKNIHRQVRGPDGITCDEAPEMIVRKAILLALEEEPGSGDPGRA